jgi:hypothetical protein
MGMKSTKSYIYNALNDKNITTCQTVSSCHYLLGNWYFYYLDVK